MNINDYQSAHASRRAQGRGIPPLVSSLLDLYGHELYDGHGGLVFYFDKASRRRMEKDLGREPVRRLSEWLDAYKVTSCRDGITITVGHRYMRIKRR